MGFVQVGECEILVAYGIGEAYLRVEIAALCVEHIDVVQRAGPVLDMGEFHVFERSVAGRVAGLRSLRLSALRLLRRLRR